MQQVTSHLEGKGTTSLTEKQSPLARAIKQTQSRNFELLGPKEEQSWYLSHLEGGGTISPTEKQSSLSRGIEYTRETEFEVLGQKEEQQGHKEEQ